VIENLKEVNERVVPLFADAAEELIKSNGGDVKKSLC
jgi:hypothetical protein